MSIPQYAKSSDPRVVAAVESRYKAHHDLEAGGTAFAHKYSGEDATPSFHQGIGGRTVLEAVYGPRPVGHGHWKPVYAGWRPGLFNPVRKEMLSVRSRLVDIPGVSRTFDGPVREGGAQVIMWPSIFVLDDFAWFSLDEEPAAEQRGNHGSGRLDPALWTPIEKDEWATMKAARG